MVEPSRQYLGSRVIVTGGSGFLGVHVCDRLGARRMRVRAMVRRGDAELPPNVEPAVVPDLLDRRAVRTALAGAGAVVHLAARAHVMEEEGADALEIYRRVNVEGTRAVLEECVRAGVSTFVFVSSVKAVGESTDTPWRDDVSPAPVDPYGCSKLEAEQLVAELGRIAGLRVHILRLPLLYGARMKGNMARLFDLVSRGWPLPFGLVNNRRALMYAGNAAAAVEAALGHRGAVPPGPFFVSDGAEVSTAQLVREIARALGRPVRLVAVPPSLIRGAGRLGSAIATVAPFPFRSAHADRLLGSLSIDTSRFGDVTGFRPPFTLQQGLAETARWYGPRRVAGPAGAADAAAAGQVLQP
jgi:nucleoside-diphosphate-sugar epimerase